MSEVFLSILAAIAEAVARSGGGSASNWGLFQPKEPQCIKNKYR